MYRRTSKNGRANQLIVQRRPGTKTQGILRFQGRAFFCALGKAGVVTIKREGDGGTPRGHFALLQVQNRRDRWKGPLPRLPARTIRCTDGWCDAVGDRNYNRPVQLPYPASHECLMRDDHLYDLFVVMDHNISRRMRHGGSAIFFHLARDGFLPTEGCVAVSRQSMGWIAPRLSHRSVIIVE